MKLANKYVFFGLKNNDILKVMNIVNNFNAFGLSKYTFHVGNFIFEYDVINKILYRL